MRLLPASVFLSALLVFGLRESPAGQWRVLDRAVWPAGKTVENLRVGGLSGVAYDPGPGVLWAVSDARKWPESKVFRFRLTVAPSGKMSLDPEGVLSLNRGKKKSEALDAEGIALWNQDRIFVSHEGSMSGAFAAGVSCFSGKTGRALFAVPIPEYFFPTPEEPSRGLQHNRGFEGVCISRPKASHLYTVNEAPLLQDLSDPQDASSGPVRILRYKLAGIETGAPEQRAYLADRDAIFGSVPEILCIEGTRLLVLERQITWPIEPRKRRIRIYEVDFAQPGATDVSAMPALRGKAVVPLEKKPVFDSSSGGLRDPENLEGMTWGPPVGGRPTLLLVGDDNFSASQQTEFVLLGVP